MYGLPRKYNTSNRNSKTLLCYIQISNGHTHFVSAFHHMPFPGTLYLPLALATGLSLHGLRKRSLSPAGALAAFAVGLLAFAPALRAFGTALIAFYLAGSRATKVGRLRKQNLEEGYEDAGYRGAMQVRAVRRVVYGR